MYALDNAISLEHEKLAAMLRFNYSAVVAGACDNCFSCKREVRQKLVK
jgi:hypothetical protein